MKTNIFFLILLAGIGSWATNGHDQGGGGDLCENRIKIIRDDIRQWIVNGGPNALTFSDSNTAEHYSAAMMGQMAITKIRCVSSGDSGYPVEVNGTAKTCRYDSVAGLGNITCDYDKFRNLSESDQYVLVHHEFAGLAGFELPNGDDSTYTISNQISEYLEDQIVKKLAVKPSSPTDNTPAPFNQNTCPGAPMSTQDFLSFFKAGGDPVEINGNTGVTFRERKCLGPLENQCTEWKYSNIPWATHLSFYIYENRPVVKARAYFSNHETIDDLLQGVMTAQVTSERGYGFIWPGSGIQYKFEGIGRMTKNCLVQTTKVDREREVGYWLNFSPAN